MPKQTSKSVDPSSVPEAVAAQWPFGQQPSLPPRLFSFTLTGHVTPVSGIHVSTADKAVTKETAGLIFSPRMINGNLVNVAAIKGETWKGYYRRIAYEIACEILRTRSNIPEDRNPFTLTNYYRNAIGGVKGRGRQMPDDVFMIRRTEARNPLAYLFGQGEPYWMTGQLSFGFSECQNNEGYGPISCGARRDDLLTDPALLASFTEAEQKLWLSYMATNREASQEKAGSKLLKREMAKLIKQQSKSSEVQGRIDALKVQVAAIDENVKQMKDKEMIPESINRPLDNTNVIYPGVVMDQMIHAQRVTPAQMGFFLKVLERASDNPAIGGHVNTGYGRFKASWSLGMQLTDHGKREPRVVVGDVGLDRFDFRLPDHPYVRECMEAYEAMARDRDVDFGFEERPEGSRRETKTDDDDDADDVRDAVD